jgi:phosphoserine phosphatase
VFHNTGQCHPDGSPVPYAKVMTRGPAAASAEPAAPGPPRRAAFLDLDRTLIPASSLFLLARGFHSRGLVGTADFVRFGWRQVAYRVGRSEQAQIVAEALGMSGGLGTRAQLDGQQRYSGRLAGPLLHGADKASAVEELAAAEGIDLGASAAYSDSVNDLPLLELVGHPAVVNPDRRLRAVAEERGWSAHDIRRGRQRRACTPAS